MPASPGKTGSISRYAHPVLQGATSQSAHAAIGLYHSVPSSSLNLAHQPGRAPDMLSVLMSEFINSPLSIFVLPCCLIFIFSLLITDSSVRLLRGNGINLPLCSLFFNFTYSLIKTRFGRISGYEEKYCLHSLCYVIFRIRPYPPCMFFLFRIKNIRADTALCIFCTILIFINFLS